MKSYVMTGAALLVLGTPAMAAKSNRAEIETTRQLNLQAAQNTAPSQPMAQPNGAGPLAMNAPPSAAPTMRVETSAIGSEAPLSAMRNPPSKIATANVLDSSGQVVGAVQKVEVTPQGQPTKVSVALIGEGDRMVVLDASALRYDSTRNEIMAQATGAQLKALSSKS